VSRRESAASGGERDVKEPALTVTNARNNATNSLRTASG